MTLIRANGIELYFEVHGAGPPILCIHGTAGSAVSLRSVVEPLSALGSVIVYDRRGSFRSEWPGAQSTSVAEQAKDAIELLEALEAVPAIVVGHSYGAAIGLALAVARPEAVHALALLEPPVPGLDRTFDSMRRRTLNDLEEVARRDPGEVAEWFLRGALGTETWESLAPDIQQALRSSSLAVVAEARGAGLEVAREDLASLRIPVLVVAGEASPLGFRRVAEKVAGLIPTARLVAVPGNHMVRPAVPAVVAFVRSVLDTFERDGTGLARN